MLTFVVYYRIHLNLNLEASARQWPNNFSHPLWGKIPPRNHTTLWDFCRLGSVFWIWTTVSQKSRDIRQGLFQALLHFQLIRLTLKAHWTFLSIYTPKRLIHSGANGFKPDNVPLSLRDTGYCHSDHKVSPSVRKVTLQLTPPFIVSALSFQDVTKLGSCSQIWTEVFEVTEIAQVRLYCRVFGWISPVSPNHCHLTPCSLLNRHTQLQYIRV